MAQNHKDTKIKKTTQNQTTQTKRHKQNDTKPNHPPITADNSVGPPKNAALSLYEVMT